jgi:hypothetical protein
MKIVSVISILLLFISFQQIPKETPKTPVETPKVSKVLTDTITNWQLYKDSKLLFKSNILNSNRYTATIKKSDKYKELRLNLFYDFKSQLDERKIQFLNKERLIATFDYAKGASKPFTISKMTINRMMMAFGNIELTIKYTDPNYKNGIVIGKLNLVDE